MTRNGERVLQLLTRVLLQFGGDGHVLCALERLRVHHVSDDCLILARQILVQTFDQLFPCNR
jgi:hypothetical protein